MDPFNTSGTPRFDLLQRPHEHLIETEGVGSIQINNTIWIDHISAGFGHFVSSRLHLDSGLAVDNALTLFLDILLISLDPPDIPGLIGSGLIRCALLSSFS